MENPYESNFSIISYFFRESEFLGVYGTEYYKTDFIYLSLILLLPRD